MRGAGAVTAPPGIVWLASFPKSGNTWFRIFLANLAAGAAEPVDINDLDERGSIASSRHEFEAMTLLDSGLLSQEDIERLRPRVYEKIAAEETEQRWIKVHDAYTMTGDGEPIFGRGLARAAVYLVRDPRDVAVSLAHHNGVSIDDAITLMGNADGALCRSAKGLSLQLEQRLLGWSGHIASWLDQGDVPVCLLRYEEMIADPVRCFESALRFAGRDVARTDVERAVRHADFAELQRQEGEKGFGERASPGATFFRSGRAGGWRDQLTDDQVGRIEEAHTPMMLRMHYELASVPAVVRAGAA
jgi:sulfotransferase family protein